MNYFVVVDYIELVVAAPASKVGLEVANAGAVVFGFADQVVGNNFSSFPIQQVVIFPIFLFRLFLALIFIFPTFLLFISIFSLLLLEEVYHLHKNLHVRYILVIFLLVVPLLLMFLPLLLRFVLNLLLIMMEHLIFVLQIIPIFLGVLADSYHNFLEQLEVVLLLSCLITSRDV